MSVLNVLPCAISAELALREYDDDCSRNLTRYANFNQASN